MFKKIALLAMLASAGLAARSSAQENLLGELYGLGVHSYYAGEYREAYDNLSACIEGGSRDPRVFYFRGLTLETLGKPEEARADFEKGAMLEVSGGGEQYPIGRSLERVQGTQRLTIERVRKVARIKHAQAELAKNKERYEESRVIEEPTISNQPDPATTDQKVEELIGPGAADNSNPFPGGGLAREKPSRPHPSLLPRRTRAAAHPIRSAMIRPRRPSTHLTPDQPIRLATSRPRLMRPLLPALIPSAAELPRRVEMTPLAAMLQRIHLLLPILARAGAILLAAQHLRRLRVTIRLAEHRRRLQPLAVTIPLAAHRPRRLRRRRAVTIHSAALRMPVPTPVPVPTPARAIPSARLPRPVDPPLAAALSAA